MKTLLTLISVALLVYIALGIYLFIKQRDFIYFPSQPVHHNYDKQTFRNGEVALKTTVINKGRSSAIIYFGGNAEAVDFNADVFSQIFNQHTVFLVKYRGYSGSKGKPTEKTLYSDALTIFDNIKDQYASISVIGRSLGSGVATYLASKRKVNKLALITPFDSMQNIAQAHYSLYPMSLLFKEKYNSIGRVQNIKSKTLILVAENDQIIPMKNTNRLINRFPDSRVKVDIIKNTGHNSISNQKRFYQLLQEFMNE